MTLDKNALKIQRMQFVEAVRFLKKNHAHKEQSKHSLYETPWHLVIGEEKSGKSSLLLNSDIHFHLSRKAKTATSYEEINWWVSKNATYLDLPGNYFSPEKKSNLDLLLKLIKRYSYKSQLRAIILVVSIKDIIQADKQHAKQAAIAEFINALEKRMGQILPIYVVVNKCDLISGFQEFFSAYAKDERQQPWGYLTLSKKITDTGYIQHEFDQLIHRLNQQLIWRLHYEPHVEKRNLIKDFPVQFAHIKPALLDFLTDVDTRLHRSCFAGVYFASAVQNLPVVQYESQRKDVSTVTETKSKPYFIHELLTHLILYHSPIRRKKTFSRFSRFIIYLVSVLMVIGVSVSLLSTFNQENRRLRKTLALVHQYQQLENKSQDQTKAMRDLSLASQLMSQPPQAYVGLNTQKNAVFKAKLDRLYMAKLNQLLLPLIKQSLEKVLTTEGVSPALSYAALKSYLMLGQREPWNATYFYHTMQAIPIANPDFLQELAKALKQKKLSASINENLVTSVKDNFSILNKNDLALIILQSYFVNQPILTLNLAANPSAASLFAFHDPKIGIPGFYTTAVFNQLDQALFQQAAIEAMSNGNPTQLAQQLKQQYYSSYAAAWQDFLNNIEIKHFKDLVELHHALDYLSRNASPVDQLIQLIQHNVPKEIVLNNVELSGLVNLTQQSTYLNELHQAFLELNRYTNVSTPEATLNLAKQRLLNQGVGDPITRILSLSNQYPSPINTWVRQVGLNSWKLILTSVAQDINAQWQQMVWPQYQAQIANRFPFDANANNEVNLDSFVNFFAPNGLLTTFFDHQLKGFIDTTHPAWRFKAINGLTLPLHAQTLKQFSRALKIKRLFFPYNNQQIYLPFVMSPMQFSVNLSAVGIKFGQQQIMFNKNKANPPVNWHWPNETPVQSVEISFIKTNRTVSQLSFSGPWAVFKWLQASQLKKDAQPKHWSGMTVQQDAGLQLMIVTLTTFNPFNLSLFNHFKLESTL